MQYKCPSCGSALYFNPASGMLECNYCASVFKPDIFQTGQSNPMVSPSERVQEPTGVVDKMQNMLEQNAFAQNAAVSQAMGVEQQTDMLERKTIQYNVYTCNSCGAELLVSGTESSSFCAYCGQPAVVFSRVSYELQPDFLIPFEITKDQAQRLIVERVSKGSFVPKELRNINLEKVSGVYVPFWVFDVQMSDTQHWKGTIKQNKSTKIVYTDIAASAHFRNITQDASYDFLDESSRRLEPYYLSKRVKFDPAYLSGFYSSRYDADETNMEYTAKIRASKLFNEETKKLARGSSNKMLYNHPVYAKTGSCYMLLPAWFFTFRYQGKKYTLLVNGQTGKVVGTIPVDTAQRNVMTVAIGVVSTIIFTAVMLAIFGTRFWENEDGLEMVATLMIFAYVGVYGYMLHGIKVVKNTLEYTANSDTRHFGVNRQEHETMQVNKNMNANNYSNFGNYNQNNMNGYNNYNGGGNV